MSSKDGPKICGHSFSKAEGSPSSIDAEVDALAALAAALPAAAIVLDVRGARQAASLWNVARLLHLINHLKAAEEVLLQAAGLKRRCQKCGSELRPLVHPLPRDAP